MKETAIVSTKDSDVFLCYNTLQSRESERTYKTYIRKTAIGLRQVDGLKPSEYLIRTAERNIIGDISFSGAEQEILSYYLSKEKQDKSRTEEADLVSCRISEILSERSFSFNPAQYLSIHRRLFEGIYRSAGQYRTLSRKTGHSNKKQGSDNRLKSAQIPVLFF